MDNIHKPKVHKVSKKEAAWLRKRGTLRPLARGTYDVQKMRIQAGNRIVTNFKTKAGQAPGKKESDLDAEDRTLLKQIRDHNVKIATALAEGKLTEEKARTKDKLDADTTKRIFKAAKKSFKKFTEEGFPKKKEFKGNPVISDYTELCLINLYLDMEKSETRHFAMIEESLIDIPIFTEFLEKVRGCGRAMGAVIVSEMNPYRASSVSAFWKFAGLDVVNAQKEDENDERWEGRSKKDGHLIWVEYTNKDGKKDKKLSITYNPFLKTKLVGVLADCFIKARSEYREFYDNYKHRMEHHKKYGPHNDRKKDPEGRIITSPARRHRMAMRYMIKMFLKDLWEKWRLIEGLPIKGSYAEDKLGHLHHGQEPKPKKTGGGKKSKGKAA